MAEGGAVAARAAALLGHVQVPLAVEGDPVLGPWLLVAPLAGYFLKGITLVTQANVLHDASGDYAGFICGNDILYQTQHTEKFPIQFLLVQ